jgi:hypothetical protein
MALFVASLRAKDTDRFLLLFSRKKPFRMRNTLQGPSSTASISYKILAKELTRKSQDEGLYSVLFDAGPDDSFRQYVDNAPDAAWRWIGGTRFVPSYEDASSKVYVTWRKEGKRWVVDTIAAPEA